MNNKYEDCKHEKENWTTIPEGIFCKCGAIICKKQLNK